MNGCLFFNRSLLRLCHALALDMRERYGIQNWSAYIIGQPSYEFVKNNKDIRYDFLVDDFLTADADKEKVDDTFLADKEKEYGVSFWNIFTADRNFIHNWPKEFYVGYNPTLSHYQVQQQFQYKIKKIEQFLDRNKPDFIIMNSVSNMGSMLLYFIARKRGTRCLIFDENRIDARVGLTEDIYGHYSSAEKKFEQMQTGVYESPKKEEARAWIEKFRQQNKPARIAGGSEATASNAGLFLKNLARKSLNSFRANGFPSTYTYSVWDYMKRNYLIWINTHVRAPQYDELVPGEEYAFFPLHLDPELSTMVYAPYYVDQPWLIRSIAQSLPIQCKLYVKEHPAMVGLRSPQYYRELKKIPNVRLIDHSLSGFNLVKNAKLITVISSTAGWEGVIFKKPVITFGPVFYNKLSMVKRCRAIEELPSLIRNSFQEHVHREEELVHLVSAMMEESIDINLGNLWYRERNFEKVLKSPDLMKLSDAMMHFIKNAQLSSAS